jgi:hypothetical protein
MGSSDRRHSGKGDDICLSVELVACFSVNRKPEASD